MARLKGTNVLNTTIKGTQIEDGYVLVAGDGYTPTNQLVIGSVFASILRVSTGTWVATLAEGYECNLNYFNVVPELYTGSSPGIVFFKLVSDNVGTTGSTNNLGTDPQVINFQFVSSSGTAEDLPPFAGFKYLVMLQVSSAGYTQSY
jgi:hypothetical protein